MAGEWYTRSDWYSFDEGTHICHTKEHTGEAHVLLKYYSTQGDKHVKDNMLCMCV